MPRSDRTRPHHRWPPNDYNSFTIFANYNFVIKLKINLPVNLKVINLILLYSWFSWHKCILILVESSIDFVALSNESIENLRITTACCSFVNRWEKIVSELNKWIIQLTLSYCRLHFAPCLLAEDKVEETNEILSILATCSLSEFNRFSMRVANQSPIYSLVVFFNVFWKQLDPWFTGHANWSALNVRSITN